MKSKKLNIVSWSGGKDSTATIVLAHENNIPIDFIIISLIWFDKSRQIYAEYPEVIEWIFNTAIPLFESWKYKVIVLTSDNDYIYHFNKIIHRSKNPNRNGTLRGFPLGDMCHMNREKVRPIERFLKSLDNEYVQYVGIAIDEPRRLAIAHRKGQWSLLEEFNIKEEDTYAILKPYNLISPTYNFSKRGGCWFCPNQTIKTFAYLKNSHRSLFDELYQLSLRSPNANFRYGKTFEEVNRLVDEYIANPPPVQLSLFDEM